jgi:hypothetical protein
MAAHSRRASGGAALAPLHAAVEPTHAAAELRGAADEAGLSAAPGVDARGALLAPAAPALRETRTGGRARSRTRTCLARLSPSARRASAGCSFDALYATMTLPLLLRARAVRAQHVLEPPPPPRADGDDDDDDCLDGEPPVERAARGPASRAGGRVRAPVIAPLAPPGPRHRARMVGANVTFREMGARTPQRRDLRHRVQGDSTAAACARPAFAVSSGQCARPRSKLRVAPERWDSRAAQRHAFRVRRSRARRAVACEVEFGCIVGKHAQK